MATIICLLPEDILREWVLPFIGLKCSVRLDLATCKRSIHQALEQHWHKLVIKKLEVSADIRQLVWMNKRHMSAIEIVFLPSATTDSLDLLVSEELCSYMRRMIVTEEQHLSFSLCLTDSVRRQPGDSKCQTRLWLCMKMSNNFFPFSLMPL